MSPWWGRPGQACKHRDSTLPLRRAQAPRRFTCLRSALGHQPCGCTLHLLWNDIFSPAQAPRACVAACACAVRRDLWPGGPASLPSSCTLLSPTSRFCGADAPWPYSEQSPAADWQGKKHNGPERLCSSARHHGHWTLLPSSPPVPGAPFRSKKKREEHFLLRSVHSRLWGERVWIRVLQMGSVCLISVGRRLAQHKRRARWRGQRGEVCSACRQSRGRSGRR